jgi:sterol 22-desaturase
VQRIAIMDTLQNASFTSPLAQASFSKFTSPSVLDGLFSTLTGLSAWTIALTVFLGLVLYDQCNDNSRRVSITLSYFPILTNGALGSYLWQKGSIVGPTFKTPFIGPFLQSMNPKFSEYMAKWASGELSCVSVFHK